MDSEGRREETAAVQVIIADDHESLRTLLGRLFSHYADLEIVGLAGTGEEAIALAGEHRSAVVVMDADMPGIGGVEATRRLVEASPGARVIGYSARENAHVMRGAGAISFVCKGSAPNVLLDAIRATGRTEAD
ncbi:MAG TPA: response regulator transcription factor [Pirellulaceae bacterium]|jgi:DNA-binding NarL/FixJ family response regulator|nr:response regulator transcription factor [Pirellulaceae bacterium]